MGKRPGLSENERQRAIGMLTAGCSQRDVAQEFNVHPSTICRLWNRFRTTGNVSDRQRSGRPRKTTVRQDRFIVTTSRRNRFMAAPRVAPSYWSKVMWSKCKKQATFSKSSSSKTSHCSTINSTSSTNPHRMGQYSPSLDSVTME